MTSRLKLILSFSLPFWTAILVDRFWVQRPFFIGQGDSIQSEVGLALGFLSQNPMWDIHHPGWWVSTLTGQWIRFMGIPKDSIAYMDDFACVMHFVLVMLAGFWITLHRQTLRLTPALMLVLGALVASQPGMIVYSRTWHVYFLETLFLTPVLLHFLVLLLKPENTLRSWIVGFFSLGLLVTVNLPALPHSIGMLATLGAFVFFKKEAILDKKFGLQGPLPRTLLFAYSVVLFYFLTGLPAYRAYWEYGDRVAKVALWLSLPCLVLGAKVRYFLFVGLFPFFSGLMLGLIQQIYNWASIFDTADRYRSSLGSPRLSFQIFAEAPWHILFLVIVLIALVVIIREIKRRSAEERWLPIAALLLSTAVFIKILGPQLTAPFDGIRFGIQSRMSLPLASIGAALFCALALFTRPFSRPVLQVSLAAIAMTVSLSLHAHHLRGAIADVRELEAKLAALPADQAIYCARVIVPEACSVHYAFRNYRPSASHDVLKEPTHVQGRFLYIYMEPTQDGHIYFMPELPVTPGSKLLILAERPETMPLRPGTIRRVLWTSEPLETSLIEIEASGRKE